MLGSTVPADMSICKAVQQKPVCFLHITELSQAACPCKEVVLLRTKQVRRASLMLHKSRGGSMLNTVRMRSEP